MRILYIIDSLPLGGAENQVIMLAKALKQARQNVHVCCLRQEGVQAAQLHALDIPVTALKMRLRYWPVTLIRLVHLMRTFRPHVVHTHLYQAGIWGRLAAYLARVAAIAHTEHCTILPKEHRLQVLEPLINRHTDLTIAVSDEIRQRNIDRYHIAPAAIRTLPNAVDIEHFSPDPAHIEILQQLHLEPSSFIIGTVARLVRPKRLDDLLLAARMVCEQVPSARFLIVGDGPLLEPLQKTAAEYGLLSNQVHFLGSRIDIPALLSAMDVFALSSESEGLPVALLEAMAASVAVIATRVGGIPQVIQDTVNGLLVPPHNASLLAQAIITLFQQPHLRQALAENGFRSVKANYSSAGVSQQILQLYHHVLKGKQASKSGTFRARQI